MSLGCRTHLPQTALDRGLEAADGGRTRDLKLGKLALYQLSYRRIKSDSSSERRRSAAPGSSLRPDEVAEEEGDDEDDQEDLGEHEEGDADPEAQADFLFKVHEGGSYRKNPSGTGKFPRRPDEYLRWWGMATTGEKGTDLRSKSRERLRAEIAEVAFNVFAERGFDQVTATEVAEAAGISRASFFRYFESKEDAVFVAQEEMGAGVAAALRERPAGEDAWTALRRALDVAAATYQRSPDAALARLRLIRCTPNLRSHQLERLAQWKEAIGAALAERLGVAGDDIKVEALVGAALGALDAASSRWAQSDGAEDLIELMDEAFAVIAGPFPQLGD
jgi:AcrR family transcriptional regulator